MSDLIGRLARRASASARDTSPPASARDRELDDVARWLTDAPISRRRMLAVTGASVVGVSVLGSAPSAPAATTQDRAARGRRSRSVPHDNGGTCGQGTTLCNPQYDPCCIDSQGNVCANDAICCPPGDKACIGPVLSGGYGEGLCCNPTDPCYVDDQGNPSCCAPAQQCPDDSTCCSADETCILAASKTTGSCCPTAQACGSVCCPDGQTCLDASTGTCCTAKQISGKTCCPNSQFPCDEQNGTCCDNGVTCCAVGPPGNTTYACCEQGQECVNQILPGNAGITSGSPHVCCPPAQLVTATTMHICCPPGSVRQPNGGLEVFGGLCCKASDVCGQNCCQSPFADISLLCIKGGCYWADQKIAIDKARAGDDGTVSVHADIAAKGNVTVQLTAGTVNRNEARQASGKPTVLGTGHAKVKHPGKQVIDVKLTHAARQSLAKAGKLNARAVIVFSQGGTTAGDAGTPFTILAPRKPRRRRRGH